MRQNEEVREVVGAATVAVIGSVETVVAVLTGITTDVGKDTIHLEGVTYWRAAASAENMTIRIRRGSTVAGTVITTVIVASVTSKLNECNIQGSDPIGEVAGAEYCITMEESKAAAADEAKACQLTATY